MKTFADVKFEVMTRPAGIVGKIPLNDQGLEISIVMNEMSYGHTKGLWEIAVFDRQGQVDLECLEHDVLGYLTFTELEQKIIEIQEELSKDTHPMENVISDLSDAVHRLDKVLTELPHTDETKSIRAWAAGAHDRAIMALHEALPEPDKYDDESWLVDPDIQP